MCERRHCDSVYLQYIWNFLDAASQRQIPNNFESLFDFIKAYYDPKCDIYRLKLELSNAIKDDCISVNGSDYQKKPVLALNKSKHDYYCYECHLPGAGLSCPSCYRVFHKECLEASNESQNQNIIHCETRLSSIGASTGLYTAQGRCSVCQLVASLDVDECQKTDLARLFPIMNDRLKSRATWKLLNHIGYIDDQSRNDYFLYKEMNTKIISQKFKSPSAYKNRTQVMVDLDLLVHNSTILYGSKADMCNSARQIRTMVKKELLESSYCIDCYFNADNSSSKNDRVCLPCRRAHRLVWYQHNGWSFWPYKVLHEDSNGFEVIAFGGRHERIQVPKDRTTDFSFSLAHDLGLRMTPSLRKALDEVKEYQANQARFDTKADIASSSGSSSAVDNSSRAGGSSLKKSKSMTDAVRMDKQSSLTYHRDRRKKSRLVSVEEEDEDSDASSPALLSVSMAPAKMPRTSLAKGNTSKCSSSSMAPPNSLLFAAASQAACSSTTYWGELPQAQDQDTPPIRLQADEVILPTEDEDDGDDNSSVSSCSSSSSSSSSDSSSLPGVDKKRRFSTTRPPEANVLRLKLSGVSSHATTAATIAPDSGFCSSSYQSMSGSSAASTNSSNMSPGRRIAAAIAKPQTSFNSPRPQAAATQSVSPAALSSASSSGLGSSLCGDPKSVDASPGLSGSSSQLVASTSQMLSSMAATLPALTPEAKLRRELEEVIHGEYAERISRLSRDREEAREEIRRLERALLDLQKKHEAEVRATKQRCWCHVCLKEAFFHCCAGVSYCSQTCQLEHWTTHHSRECRRANASSESASSK